MPSTSSITAAGGVVWRHGPGGVEVALVHRPRFDDWTLPKGKLRAGEPAITAAVREIEEELGSSVTVSRRIGAVHYLVGAQRKTVTYWVMKHVDGRFRPGPEVDQEAWLTPESAEAKLTYPPDRTILSDFCSMPLPDSLVVLVRHAKAGRRAEWRGDDRRRPLDVNGRRQAVKLVKLLQPFGPTRIVSADPARCVQTVQPLARACGLSVQVDTTFADENLLPHATAEKVGSLAGAGAVTVVCSQGVTIPTVVDELAPHELISLTRKGGFWVLSFSSGQVVSADYYADATR